MVRARLERQVDRGALHPVPRLLDRPDLRVRPSRALVEALSDDLASRDDHRPYHGVRGRGPATQLGELEGAQHMQLVVAPRKRLRQARYCFCSARDQSHVSMASTGIKNAPGEATGAQQVSKIFSHPDCYRRPRNFAGSALSSSRALPPVVDFTLSRRLYIL